MSFRPKISQLPRAEFFHDTYHKLREKTNKALFDSPLLKTYSYGIFNKPLSKDFKHPKTLLSDKYESLDYDPCENSLVLSSEKKLTFKDVKCIQFQRWLVMLLIGVLTAVIACIIDIAIDYLTEGIYIIMKYRLDNMVQNLSIDPFLPYDKTTDIFTSFIMKPYFLWIAFGLLFVILPVLLVVYIEPMASGSGISQIKCFLNGVKIPNIVRLKTLTIKIFGIICAISSGLIIGKEGPMIHIGSIIGAGVSQGCSSTLKLDLKIFESFRTDKEKRDFVSAGAAAGLSAAFGAPVGGVLLSLEEGASFWNQALTWKIFFASMTSTFTLNVIMSAYRGHPGELSNSGLINFGKLNDIYYSIKEVPIFIIMAIIGGILGAIFNHINLKMTLFRTRHITKSFMKVVEVLLMFCNDGEYNSIATMFFQTAEQRIRGLLHDSPGTYNTWWLLYVSIVWFFLACWTFGISVPSGIFIPCLMIGAAWGRLIGVILQKIFPHAIWAANPSKFALIGAAVQLGGVVRMTLSLTVMLIEATGNITFGLVIMLCLMITKWVGDLFNEGVYDMHIHLLSLPFLDWEPPPLSSHITGNEIMSHPVTTFRTIEKVSTIIQVLRTQKHNGFPIVDTASEPHRLSFGRFRGLILRSQLLVILMQKFSKNKIPQIISNTPPDKEIDSLNILRKPDSSPVLINKKNDSYDNQSNFHSFSFSSSYKWRDIDGKVNYPTQLPLLLDHNKIQSSFEDSDKDKDDPKFNNAHNNNNYNFIKINDTRGKRKIAGRNITNDTHESSKSAKSYGKNATIENIFDKTFNSDNLSNENILTLKDFKDPYPRFFDIHDIEFPSPESLLHSQWVDLQPYCCKAPYTISYSATLPRVFRLFRALGLRHLTVINEKNEVVGMITRKDVARFRWFESRARGSVKELKIFQE
ncbi:H(+)/Cl(-) exchange transporter 7-like isoform X2 [Gordionus sp. m RMFG-2023]|uniref:H(+)/Cl(-) exchange transporter 7-like isoform X2 n=1 Tax=Gordionus sp. m RMFG-2023 TaxID=3053472 RepID=UPI0031FCF6A6